MTVFAGKDLKLFDQTVVSVDGDNEFGPMVRVGFANGSFKALAAMKPDEALKLSATLAKMAAEVTK